MTQAGLYRMEPELMQGPPRQVRFKKAIGGLRIGLGLLLGLMTVLALALGVTDVSQLSALHAGGKPMMAHITDKLIEERQSGKSYFLDFAFQVDGVTYKGMDRMQQEAWEGLQAGDPIAIVYLPTNPNVHRLGSEVSAEELQRKQRFWIVLNLFIAALFGGLFGAAEASFRKEWRLLRDGIAVPGEIVSSVSIASSPTAARRTTFRYAISPTETRSKTLLLTAAQANRLAGQPAVTVLYHPVRPQQVGIYSLFQTVELA